MREVTTTHIVDLAQHDELDATELGDGALLFFTANHKAWAGVIKRVIDKSTRSTDSVSLHQKVPS
jgi:hypothetical protein